MSEVITIKKNNSDDDTTEDSYEAEVVDDFPSMLKEFFGNIPFKLSFIMFILLLVLFSKQFIEGALNPLGDSLVDGDCPTNTGTIVLCIFAAIGLIVADLLIKAKIF